MLIKDVRRKQLNLVSLGKILAIGWVVLSLAEASVTYICLKDAANIEGNPFARQNFWLLWLWGWGSGGWPTGLAT
jgi:hypothetical protein